RNEAAFRVVPAQQHLITVQLATADVDDGLINHTELTAPHAFVVGGKNLKAIFTRFEIVIAHAAVAAVGFRPLIILPVQTIAIKILRRRNKIRRTEMKRYVPLLVGQRQGIYI